MQLQGGGQPQTIHFFRVAISEYVSTALSKIPQRQNQHRLHYLWPDATKKENKALTFYFKNKTNGI